MIDHTGKTYGHWRPLERKAKEGFSIPGVALPWRCECTECGTEEWLVPNSFYSKNPAFKPKLCPTCMVSPRKQARDEFLASRAAGMTAKKEAREALAKDILDGKLILPSRLSEFREMANERGISWEVTESDLLKAFKDQGGKCALSGRVLTMKTMGTQSGTASLDRKDSLLGYTPDNVQWVDPAINFMKYKHSGADFIALCRAVVETADARAGMQTAANDDGEIADAIEVETESPAAPVAAAA